MMGCSDDFLLLVRARADPVFVAVGVVHRLDRVAPDVLEGDIALGGGPV